LGTAQERRFSADVVVVFVVGEGVDDHLLVEGRVQFGIEHRMDNALIHVAQGQAVVHGVLEVRRDDAGLIVPRTDAPHDAQFAQSKSL
jgi:hypothetical protein